MAWPCISRVCCLARFWNQFDKSDLSVPLTIQNYSDIGEQEVRSVTRHVPTELRGSPRQQGPSAPRGSSRGRREPVSYKPREDYQPPDVPFPSTTQYKQDFKPWPIPRKETFPWISNGGSGADGVSDPPVNVHPQQQQHHAGQPQGEWAEREERGAGTTRTSSYRQEYRPWTGAKPAKSTRRNPPAPYISTETEASQTPPETSYQAAYSGEAHRSLGLHQVDHCPAAPSTIVQPASVPQPKPTPLQSGCTTAAGPPGILQGHPPERNNVTTVKGEEHLVRTKLPPNPSAVFQSGSRVFSI